MGASDGMTDKKRKISIPDGEALSLDEMRVSRQRLLDQSKVEKQAVDKISNTLKELMEVINEERFKEHIPMNSEEFERCKVRSEATSIVENRDGHLPEEVVKVAKELLDFVGLFEQQLPMAKPSKKKPGKDNHRERERDFPSKGGNKTNATNAELRRVVEELQRRVSKLEDQVKHLQKSK